MLGTPFERELRRLKMNSPFRAAENVGPSQVDTMRKFASDFEIISDRARLSVKPGRNLSLFQTKLEEAAMFLNKAITHDGILENDGA